MLEKNQLIEQIDEAIKRDSTSSKDKELLKKLKTLLEESEIKPLKKARDKKEYLDISLIIAKIVEILLRIFGGSG